MAHNDSLLGAMGSLKTPLLGAEEGKTLSRGVVTHTSKASREDIASTKTGLSSIDKTRLVAEIEANNITMSISVDQESDEALIQLRSKQTGEVVASIPAEHSRNIKNTVRAVMGRILDSKA